MFSYLWLQSTRFALLIPGIIVAYFSAREVFPYFHQRLPFAAAIFVTYVMGAYARVPAILRVWRVFVPAKHLPLYSVTPAGHAADPLNIGLLGSRKQLILAMEACGWHVAKPVTIGSIAATLRSIALNRPYHGMPMSRLYLFGRKQDIGFEMQLTNHGRGHRHHVRFWVTTLTDIQDIETLRLKRLTKKAQQAADDLRWAGAASRDNGIALMKQSLQVSHAVDPDTNSERDFMVEQLEANGRAKMVSLVRLHRAYSLINRTWFASLHTDGRMAILQLKK